MKKQTLGLMKGKNMTTLEALIENKITEWRGKTIVDHEHFLNELKVLIADVYAAGRQEAIEEAIQCAKSVKAITPTVEPPPNRLSQNQIFVGGQINMLMRVGEALSSLKDKSK